MERIAVGLDRWAVRMMRDMPIVAERRATCPELTGLPEARIMISPVDRGKHLPANSLRIVRLPLSRHLPTGTRQMPLDLILVIDCWDRLPEAVRAGNVAMVRASDTTR
jgi:hypothetical protein